MLETCSEPIVSVEQFESAYLEDLVGTAHGCDFMVSMRTTKFAEVAHWPATHLAVHVNFLHLVLRTHQHLQPGKWKLVQDGEYNPMSSSLTNNPSQEIKP